MNCVEDEIHFLVECPLYERDRSKLLTVVKDELTILDFTSNKIDLFITIMTSKSINIVRALSDFIWEAFQRRETLISGKSIEAGSSNTEDLEVVVYINDEY